MGNSSSSITVTVDLNASTTLSITPYHMSRVLRGCETSLDESTEIWDGILELSFESSEITGSGRWAILDKDHTQVLYSSTAQYPDSSSSCLVSLPSGEYTLITGPTQPSQSQAMWSYCFRSGSFASTTSFLFIILDGECFPQDSHPALSSSQSAPYHVSRRLQTGSSYTVSMCC